MSAPPRRQCSKAEKLAHLAWAALSIAAAAALVLGPQGGHPPAIILLPVVALAWPMGHAVIRGVAYLAAKGRGGVSGRSWPAALIPVLIGTGVISLFGLVQLAGTALRGNWYPVGEPARWLQMQAVLSLHGACLVGLLMRKRWSRLLSALLASGWAVLLAAQLAEHRTSLQRNDPTETAFAIALLLFLVILAVHLAASPTVKSFLTR